MTVTPNDQWRTITDAPKDGSTVLVWDGEVLGYPVAALWRWDEVREKPVDWRKRPKRMWPVVACKNGRWEPVEEDLANAVSCVGGLIPTHWLPWEPGPTPATCDAWFAD